jgi:hypothetical protein
MVEDNGGGPTELLQRWEYGTHFREYVLLLGRKGEKALESIEQYPARIELDMVWHNVLNNMRSETQQDKHERFSVVGFTDTSREFYFPIISIKGEPYSIAPSLVSNTIHAAKEQHGVTSILGDLHTHNYVGPLTFVDFHGMLDKSRSHVPMIRGLINPSENIFAFKTRETYMVNDFGIPKYGTTEGFKDYWMNKAGFQASEKPNHIKRNQPTADMWATNIAIAQAHYLALYRGEPGQDLIRSFP